MNRTFLSLYAVIVLCVILVGWGLDELWQYFSPPPVLTPAQLDLLTLIERQLDTPAAPQHFDTLGSQVDILHLDDFAQSSFTQKLATGAPILLHNKQGEEQIYKRVQSHTIQNHKVIRLTLPNATARKHNNILYPLLLTLFYSSIGLAVFLWVWPLMRDVRKLERHTQHIGKHSLPEVVTVMRGSALKNLASAFNIMAGRIKDLVASHKEMTYAVSHELRTPLARMKFALAMLQDTSDTQNTLANNHISGLAQDINEMDALITQLLSYAGYEQSCGPLEQQQGDMAFLISELIQRAKKTHSSQSQHTCAINITLVCKNQQTHASCDWQLMERAIFNLIHNALRFARSQIVVSFDASDSAYYLISVADDGPGIPSEQQARIFESFVRLESTPNAQVRGFGLGLAIVHRVLKWHEGTATANTSATGGAQFILQWPAK
ncbi:ATP-binding protein [Marinagarivorans algicola]|uniref:ATP-binding protein n=1 Tax=Marinagarivorans algicola TaxID=1513270 RepID=UPI0006B56F23|nr:ATP-binding protein [Marinagarivorans algicola]